MVSTGCKASDGHYQVTIRNEVTGRWLAQFWEVTSWGSDKVLITQQDKSGNAIVFDGAGPGWNKVSLRSTKENIIGNLCVDNGRVGVAYALECNGGTYQQWSRLNRSW